MNDNYILAIGNPVYDIISTPKLRRKDRVLSGCSTNGCLALSRLGLNTHLIGNVGADFYEIIKSQLSHNGIEYDLRISDQTGGFRLIYDDRGDRELSILGDAGVISPKINISRSPSFIILGPILQEITLELVEKYLEKFNVDILLDPQGLLRTIENGEVLHEATDEFYKISKMCTILKANELETRVITGIEPRQFPNAAVKELYKYCGKIAIVTLAEAGSIIFDGENIYKIPAYKTNAIDPTGAGDTYSAGFIYQYLKDPADLQKAGYYGSAVASIMVENSGPEFILTPSQVDSRVEKLYSNAKFQPKQGS